MCKVPSVEGSSAAGLQRCCSKLLLSCDAAGASAAILLNRYRAPPIPQAYKRAFVCSKLRSAQMLRARCPDLLPRTHTATQTHPHACSVYRMRAACLHPRAIACRMSLPACARMHLVSRGLSHRPSSKSREQVRFELRSSGFIPSKLAVAVGVRGSGRQAREGAIGSRSLGTCAYARGEQRGYCRSGCGRLG